MSENESTKSLAAQSEELSLGNKMTLASLAAIIIGIGPIKTLLSLAWLLGGSSNAWSLFWESVPVTLSLVALGIMFRREIMEFFVQK